MKKALAFLLAIVMLCAFAALAESESDYGAMTDDELQALRQSTSDTLMAINMELGKRIHNTEISDSGNEVLGKIRDLFPDEEFAAYIRDNVQKFSIDQTVTQKDLDEIREVSLQDLPIYDITGVGYLRNLETLIMIRLKIQHFPDDMRNCVRLIKIWSSDNNFMAIPEWIGELTALQKLDISSGSGILHKGEIEFTSLPESIGNLVNLTDIFIANTRLTELPESIGNLTRLTELTIRGSYLKTLPDSIGNLINLKKLDIRDNDITTLPESVYNLSLEELNMSGNPIK